MACNGVVCNGHCSVNVCTTYRAPNAVWDYTRIGEPGSYLCSTNVNNPFPTAAGSKIHDENYRSLLMSINDERVRRGMSHYVSQPIVGSDEGIGTIIYGTNIGVQETMLDIVKAIRQIPTSSLNLTISDGRLITARDIITARNEINRLRAEVICPWECGGNLWCTCHNDCVCHY